MHELGIAQQLVAIVGDAAAGRRVHRVWVRIGERSAVEPDALRFCFDVVASGTLLEGATLEIAAVAAGWQCRDCRAALGASAVATCARCGSSRLVRRSGDELDVEEMEVETCA